jgi:predicted TIM-barrel fold metal-dependent hydrolase
MPPLRDAPNERSHLPGRQAPRPAETPLQYLQDHLVVTTSDNWFEPTFICTLLALGADNILFADDWPFEPNMTAMHFLNQLPISELDREKIAHLNAERLLRL